MPKAAARLWKLQSHVVFLVQCCSFALGFANSPSQPAMACGSRHTRAAAPMLIAAGGGDQVCERNTVPATSLLEWHQHHHLRPRDGQPWQLVLVRRRRCLSGGLLKAPASMHDVECLPHAVPPALHPVVILYVQVCSQLQGTIHACASLGNGMTCKTCSKLELRRCDWIYSL